METTNTIDFGLLVTNCAAYQGNSTRLDAINGERAELISANGKLRQEIVPLFKSIQNEKWAKVGKDIKAAIVAANIKDVDGLLGVLKTCFEYKILPTAANADRLRKAEKWTAWNGAVVANTYGKVHAPKIEQTKTEDTKTEDTKTENVTVAAPVSPATTQKTAATSKAVASEVKPLHSNVSSSSEAPITAREHLGILLDQLTKNETFRGEFCPTLALMLDTEVSTLTRCIIQARDVVLNGKKP